MKSHSCETGRRAPLLLDIRNLAFGYDGADTPVLADIDLSLAQGEVLALLGNSGCGKSTLLNLISGIEVARKGSVLIDGVEMIGLDDRSRTLKRRRDIGFIYQFFNLIPTLTALENIALVLELNGCSGAESTVLAMDALASVELQSRAGQYPDQLSGGEQQRVAIARAFASQAQILFADEPTGNLDSATGARVIDLLFALNQEYATTLVLVTHDDRLARKCHRTVRLVAGEVVSDDINEEVAA